MTHAEFSVFHPDMKDVIMGQGRLSHDSDPRTITLRGRMNNLLIPPVKVTHLREETDPCIVTQDRNEWEVEPGEAREIELKHGEVIRIAHFAPVE